VIDWVSESWEEMPKELLEVSFVQTGVNNTGKVEIDQLHSKLKALLNDQEQQEEEVEPTGLTDSEGEEGDSGDEDKEDLPDI
jgi:hypothetical protein